MTARTQTIFKTALALTCCSILFIAAASPATAAPDAEETLLRVEVQASGGETVKISLPLGLIETIYAIMPEEIHEACEELELTPKVIFQEFADMEGEDLVRITGEDEVRVWFEQITEENAKILNFVTVYVKEEGNRGHEVHVKVPKGLVKLSARVIKELGIVDECIQLPPEVRRSLHKITHKTDTE
ncbi:MAG: hypothetical protein JXR73_11140 [Candidatus Omnitrophica bacterium]|nr:hypothetical protein [Candidatus Omnitrophota bacterium]